VVDLAIASNFARELTQEQFSHSRRTPRRSPSSGRTTATAHVGRLVPREHDASTTAHSASREGRRRLPTTPIARVLSRLVQAR
jgi:hypothetical protein